MEESRKLKAIVAKAGGNAGKQSLNYKMSIPSKWANDMGISQEDRQLKATYKDGKILIEKV